MKCIIWAVLYNKKASFVYQTKDAFLNDVFRCAERDVSFGSDAHFVRDICLRQVKAEHITIEKFTLFLYLV